MVSRRAALGTTIVVVGRGARVAELELRGVIRVDGVGVGWHRFAGAKFDANVLDSLDSTDVANTRAAVLGEPVGHGRV